MFKNIWRSLIITVISLSFIGLLSSPIVAQPGSLSNQVLRLLTRTNVWTGVNSFASTVGVTLSPGAAPSPTTNRLYNIGGNLYFNGTLVATSAGAGTVTSVDLTVPGVIFSISGNPVTSSGTLALSLLTQTANTVFSGPTSGGAATPTFRAIVDNDIPDTITINGTNTVTWASVNKSGSSLADLATKSASSLTSGTLPNAQFPATLPAASGVNLTALNATQLTSGTVPNAAFPATLPATSGVNLTALNATNLGSGTVPAARMPALTGDITTSAGAVATTLANTAVTPSTYGDATHSVTITIDSKGRITAASAPLITFPTVSLTSGVSGILPKANGGTGISTASPLDGQLLIGKTSDSSWNQATLTGTANQIIVTNGGGTITLTTPQSINTAATPQFARLGLGAAAGASALITGSGQDDRGFFDDGNSGTADTINWNSGQAHKSTLTGSPVVYTFSNPISGNTYKLLVIQDGSGSRLVTWPGTVTWRTGVAPTLTTGAGKTDICTFFYNGSVYYGDCSLNY